MVWCFDGVTQCVYPRVLTYSADYPKKLYAIQITLIMLTIKFQNSSCNYSDSKNPFHTNLNGGARSAPPNTVGIALSFGGVINSTYPWLQNRPLGHVIWFAGRRDMANPKQ